MKQKGFWRALERLASGAVMAEWARELDGEMERGRQYLLLTPALAESHPCVNALGCGHPHRVEELKPGVWEAVCGPEEWCPSFRLENRDLMVFGVELGRLCRGIAGAFGLGPPAGHKVAQVRVEAVGTYGPARSGVYLMFPGDGARMMREVERLFGAQPDPFVLVTPTGVHCTADVESALRRQGCMHVALSEAVMLRPDGSLGPSAAAAGLLAEFGRRLAERPSVRPVLEGIHREIASVRDDRRNLLAGRARLEQMHGEGMFAFARHIDREARELFLAIMAGGDVAKAARELEMKDSTLRSKLEKWPKRGKAYAALAEIVRWRKSIKGQAGMEFAKRVASGAERDVDFPALIRDTVAELEEMAPDNWEERCADLADALRKAVS